MLESKQRRVGANERATLIPGEILPLFNDTFVRSCELLEEYVARLAVAAFRATGLEHACTDAVTVDEAIVGAGLVPGIARVPAEWLLATLAARGWVDRVGSASGTIRYRAQRPFPAPDADKVLAEQAQLDARCLPSYRIMAFAAERYPAVLRGEISGEQALFDPEGISAWLRYFSNSNPLYAVTNAIGAVAAERALPPGGGEVLELGGGFGSGAEALLARLEATGRGSEVSSYRFTELVAMFLRRADKALRSRFPRYPLAFGALDINRPFADGGIAP